MKKIFGTLAILFLGLLANAQNGNVTQPYSMIDSVAFVGTTPYGAYNYLAYPVTNNGKDTVRFARLFWLGIRVSQTTPVASIHITIHKDSSGTINAAKAYLDGSDDGINWSRLPDTVTCTNITTNFHDWVLPNAYSNNSTRALTSSQYGIYAYQYLPYLYYRVIFLGVSTSKADLKAWFVPRR